MYCCISVTNEVVSKAGLSYLEWIRCKSFSLGCSPSRKLLELKPVGLHLQWKRNISPQGAVLILLSVLLGVFLVWVFWDWVFCFVLVVGFLSGLDPGFFVWFGFFSLRRR